jgi:outer membrane protein OmpA-like peptidoglycan-associated protein
MTTSRTCLSLLLPALTFLAAPLAQANDLSSDRAPGASDGAAPLIQLAQKIDYRGQDKAGDQENKEGKGKHKGKKDKDGGRGGSDAAKGDARKQKQPAREQAKETFQKKKQDADAARKKAIEDKRLQLQQAKDKGFKQKQETERPRIDAITKQPIEPRQAKDKAWQQKRDAETARQKAIQDKRDAEAARQKAVQDKRDAEAARLKAIKDKQNADAARQKAAQDQRRKDGGAKRPGKFDRAKSDQEFERALRDAKQKKGSGREERFEASKASKFERFRRERKVTAKGSRDIIVEPDKRVIVRDEKRVFIRHDDGERFRRKGKEVRRERRKDGTWMVVTAGLAGALIYSILDDHDRVIRRSRRDRDGREYVLFDDRRAYRSDYGPDQYSYIDLPPPVVRIPRDRYIVDYDRASADDLYDALNAPPIEELDRGYTLDEVRQNYSILERMRRVDLNSINFEFASWEVTPDQYRKLERIAQAMRRVLDRSPGELFLIEGHTDAVGSEIDNLSLSDRRAEEVAIVLTDEFGIPPENLTTQGYGEEYLKEMTDGPSWINRRVGVRRITPLLSRDGWEDPS